MKGVYCIAEHRFALASLYPAVHELCAAYRCGGPPSFLIETCRADIEQEREKAAAADRMAGRPVVDHSEGYLESVAVYRKLARRLLEDGILLFHGSAIAVDGMGYVFAAKSGTGKSTHARLWRQFLGDRAVMVNDDKPLLKIGPGGVTVYGTPWDGNHRLSSNIAVPLRAVCLLERAERNSIRPISPREAWPALLTQSYRPDAPDELAKTLPLVDGLAHGARLYRLGCNMEPEAARLAFETMSKGESL